MYECIAACLIAIAHSAALSRLEEWRECEMDCGIALALGYRHADMRKKRAMIYHRRSVCRRKRGDKEKGVIEELRLCMRLSRLLICFA